MSPEFLTHEGFQKLEEELEHLRTVKRKEVAARLHEAAESSLGEFVEDPEFEAAKNEQSFVEGRIRELELLLANAKLIEKNRSSNGEVEIGSVVVIKEGRYKPEEYQIVGAAEANPREGKISHESPLGKALIGAKEGEKVEVAAPSGAFKVKVVEVK
ncbi:MAG TPA: transcription elongation factor GreA [Anaerolineales bacterium]|nr:transcription elongation factor GreA [Anaerolineales bacterium]